MIRRFARNYIERHRHPINQILHAFGLPITFVVPVVFALQQDWLWAALAFVAGYALQFAGHVFEGNDAGEMILVKKSMGRPYTEFGPLSQNSQTGNPKNRAA